MLNGQEYDSDGDVLHAETLMLENGLIGGQAAIYYAAR